MKVIAIRDIYWSDFLEFSLFPDVPPIKDDIGIPKGTIGEVTNDYNDGWFGVSLDGNIKDVYGNKLDWAAFEKDSWMRIDE